MGAVPSRRAQVSEPPAAPQVRRLWGAVPYRPLHWPAGTGPGSSGFNFRLSRARGPGALEAAHSPLPRSFQAGRRSEGSARKHARARAQHARARTLKRVRDLETEIRSMTMTSDDDSDDDSDDVSGANFDRFGSNVFSGRRH